MKIKIEDLTDEQLDEWAALAQGWEEDEFEEHGQVYSEWKYAGGYISKDKYTPTTNPAQWARLIERFEIWLSNDNTDCDNRWIATTKETHVVGGKDLAGYGPTPAIAICRAVIASVYGDEVEVSDE